MKTKSIKEMKETEVIAQFAGTLVHDHETALYHFGTNHAECNAHILRYLRKNSEETGNAWSEEMADLLKAMNELKKDLETNFCEDLLGLCSTEYDAILQDALQQNKKTKGKIAKEEEYTLINRLKRYKENHLLFAMRADVPFTNNMSERDLRKCKNRQKSSGGFRTAKGKEIYCKMLSVIETCRRKGMDLIVQIQKILQPIPCLE
ncbi:MAG: transposase [Proteobacteria bacterium]|nr:transposase [Pseudomonadota bacterium]